MTDNPLIAGRYEIIEELGRGGMGVVYRTRDHLTATTVALKRVTRSEDKDSESPVATPTIIHVPDALRIALTNEFRTLASLRHPNIITVLDYGFDRDRQPFFTMEHLADSRRIIAAAEGQSLVEQVRLLVQMLQALDFLHRRRIFHRDLKPANVLVTTAGRVKVLDFGLSVVRDKYDTDPTLTAGTFSYMAPELIRSERTTAAADLYSVGVIAYELFTGVRPFEAQRVSKLLTDVMTAAPDLERLQGLSIKLTAVIARLLSKNPDERYPTAEATITALCNAVEIPMPEETVEIRESYLHSARFVGREGELRVLTAGLEETVRGRGEAWLIGGESGVGKTRLLSELRTQALVRGVLVLTGQAVEGGSGDAVWRDVLRGLILLTPPPDDDAGVLKAYIPDIERLLGRPVPDAAELSPDETLLRLQAVITSLVGRINTPLLILLEDLQWAGESALQLINHTVGLLNDQHVMIVGSYQDDVMPDLPDGLPGMKRFQLRRLNERAIRELSAAMLGPAGEEAELIDLLQRETEGNVFFLVETIRALAEQAGRLGRVGEGDLPDTVTVGGVQQVIEERLARLPAGYQAITRAAAVAGRGLDLRVLRLVNSRLAQPADFEDWLLHAGNAAVLEAQGFRWRFTHDRLRKALVDAIPEDERRQLNRLLAGAVEAIYGAQSSEHAAALARHWEAAGEPVRAADYLRRAAAASLATSAYREAITIVERALALLADHPATPQDLLAGLIGMRARASINVSDYEAAQRDYQRLHDVGAMTDNAQLTAEAVRGLGRVAEGKGEYPTALERYRDALERFRTLADKAGQAAALQAIGGVLYRQNAYDEALQHLNESLSYYDETGSKLGTADVLRSMGSVLHATGQPEQGIQHWRRASIIYRKLGNRHGLATCLNNIGLAAEMRGDHEEAKGYYEQALALKREIGNLRSIGVSLNNLGVVAINLEQYDEASRLLQEAIDIAHAIGDQQGVADAFNNLGLVELYRGSYQDAERSLLQSRAICEAIGDRWGIALTHLNLGKVRRDQGHPDDARAEFAQAVAVAQAINLTAVLLQVTVEMATLLTGSDDDRAQAVALLTFAVNHERIPGAERDRAASLLDDLKRVLPAEAYQQGREHAAGLTLESVVERLRR